MNKLITVAIILNEKLPISLLSVLINLIGMLQITPTSKAIPKEEKKFTKYISNFLKYFFILPLRFFLSRFAKTYKEFSTTPI